MDRQTDECHIKPDMAISAFRRPRKENCNEFEANLTYIVDTRPAGLHSETV